MKNLNVILLTSLALLSTFRGGWAQEDQDPFAGDETVKQQAQEIVAETRDKVDEIAERLDKSERASEVKTGILNPIYLLAEYLSFPAFHWLAFALMVTGVVNFALQLVLAKLIVLSKLSLSLTEILSDAFGLAISLIGLVLTTQAATENSDFTQSSAAVLSAAVAGLVVGFMLYLWGQSQEIQAVEGRKRKSKS